jgi:HEAT repeat protein
MTWESILVGAAIALGVLLVCAVALLVLHGLWSALSERHWRQPTAAARAALADTAERLELAPDSARAVERLTARRRIDLFAELAPSVAGAPRVALAEAAREVGVVERAEQWCASGNWRRRLRGARLLTTLGGGGETVPPLLHDSRPEVRAQAAEWAGGHPDPAVAATLIAMLDDPRGLARFTVMDSLIRLGATAVEPVGRAIDTATGPAAIAALRVGAAIRDPRLAPYARHRLDDEDAAVRAAAVRLIGAVGGDENAAAVEGRLDDGAEEVRAAAAVALGRLGHWPAAPQLGQRLRDPAWIVRRNSALALRSFGPAGELLLNRALREDDAFARDIARQTLDLPELTLPA